MAHDMLSTAPMSRSVLVAAVLVATSASVASAGGFVGLGVGTGAASSGDVPYEENGRSGRLELGYRFGRFSVEGLASRYGMAYDAKGWDATTLGLAGKVNFPLGDKFEAFGRLGLQRTTVSWESLENGGNGFLLGGGFEYRLPVAAVGVSIFVDYTILYTSMKNIQPASGNEWGLTSRIWTLGATLSF